MEDVKLIPSGAVRSKDERIKKGDFIIPPKDWPMQIDSKFPVNMLPKTVYRLHGCNTCEWRDTNMCGLGKKSKGTKEDTGIVNGICTDRMHYLMNFLPDNTSCELGKFTYEMWRNFYNQAIAQTQLMSDWQKLKDAISREESQKTQSILRRNWIELHKIITDGDARTIDRQTPKKLEVEDKRLTANDVITLMREAEHALDKDKAIDADVKN